MEISGIPFGTTDWDAIVPAHHLRSSQRARALADRGLDFEDAAIVFEGITVEVEDLRKNYGEPRIIRYGLLSARLVVIGYTPRGTTRHIFSMRKANDREKARLAPYFEIRPRQS